MVLGYFLKLLQFDVRTYLSKIAKNLLKYKHSNILRIELAFDAHKPKINKNS